MRKATIIERYSNQVKRYVFSKCLSTTDRGLNEYLNAEIRVHDFHPTVNRNEVSMSRDSSYSADSMASWLRSFDAGENVKRADRFKRSKMTEAEFWELFDKTQAVMRLQKGGQDDTP